MSEMLTTLNSKNQHLLSGIAFDTGRVRTLELRPTDVDSRRFRIGDWYTGATLTIPKPEKPFVIIDNVVYINSKLIKENTL